MFGFVLFSLVCGPRLRLGPKKRKLKNSTVQYPPVWTSRSINNIYLFFTIIIFSTDNDLFNVNWGRKQQ